MMSDTSVGSTTKGIASSADNFLLIFEDGNVQQFSEWDDGGGAWAESVEGGYLDVIRFNRENDSYERFEITEAGQQWTTV